MERPVINYTELVRAVALHDPNAEQALYGIFDRGMRFMIGRRLGSENLEDILHDAFLSVLESIRVGRINDPEKLVGYIRVVVNRSIATEIGRRVFRRQSEQGINEWTAVDASPSAESLQSMREEIEMAHGVLTQMKPLQRELLVRYYLTEDSQLEICRALGITYNQFRNSKNRSKTAFKKKLNAAVKKKTVGTSTRIAVSKAAYLPNSAA